MLNTSSLIAFKEILQTRRQVIKSLFSRIIRDREAKLAVVRSRAKPEREVVAGQSVTPSRRTLSNLLRDVNIRTYEARRKIIELKYEDLRNRFIRNRKNAPLKDTIERIFQVDLTNENIRKEVDVDVHLIISALTCLQYYKRVLIITRDREFKGRAEHLTQLVGLSVNRLDVLTHEELIRFYEKRELSSN